MKVRAYEMVCPHCGGKILYDERDAATMNLAGLECGFCNGAVRIPTRAKRQLSNSYFDYQDEDKAN